MFKQLISCATVLSVLALSAHANDILPIARGVTLAHIAHNGTLQTLAVTADQGRTIQAVNLSEISGHDGDVVLTYRQLGYDGIIALINSAPSTSTYHYEQLLSPAGQGAHHIALGFNYPEHADEVDEKEEPFLFLKTSHATREQPILTADGVLLDYEAEICARPMQAISKASDLETTPFGFFLCGDFTDRARLMRGIDLDNMQSGAGFSVAKSLPGYFPTGPYMVIPQDKDAFLDTLTFTLARNRQIQQQSSTSAMIWSLQTSIQKIFAADAGNFPTHTVETQHWLERERIPDTTVILTGTPASVIMRPPSLSYKITRFFPYLFSGSIRNMPVREYVIERYIDDLLDDKKFLQPGEQIQLQGKYLGQMHLDVQAEQS